MTKRVAVHFVVLLLFSLLLTGAVSSEEKVTQVEIPAKHSKVQLYVGSEADMKRIIDAGVVLDHFQAAGTTVEVVLNDWEIRALRNAGVNFRVVVDDLEAEYKKRAAMSASDLALLKAEMAKTSAVENFGFGSMGGYYTFSEIVDDLNEMASLFPNLITVKQSIGTTIEGRSIWMVKISDNPNIDENEEEVLFTALMHAREPQAMASVMYFMWYLLENYGSDSVVDFLVNNREMYFIPCINPDGYVYNEQTNPNGGGFWRKNRRDNGNGTFGVDINRNFDYQWGFDNSGSSPNPGSSTYRGTAPASEPETQAVQNFAISKQLTMAFNYHSVAGSFNFSWGYRPNFFTPDHETYQAFSQQMSTFNGWRYGTPWSNLGYVTNGYSNDWFYGEQTLKNKTFSWTVEESGGSFWPLQSQIIPLAQSSIYQNFILANGVSGGMPSILEISTTPKNPPIVIGPSGGNFSFDVAVVNNTNSSWQVDFWTFVTNPNGGTTDPLIGPNTLELPGGQSAMATFTQNIPGGIDAGTRTYNVVAGLLPGGTVFDSDSFQFNKSINPTLAKSSISVDNWDGYEIGQVSVLSDAYPESFVLEQNYPNPFNPSTVIQYGLPQDSHVSVRIYNTLGQEIATLVDGFQSAGQQRVVWNGKDEAGHKVPSGIYIYKIEAGPFVNSKKLILTK